MKHSALLDIAFQFATIKSSAAMNQTKAASAYNGLSNLSKDYDKLPPNQINLDSLREAAMSLPVFGGASRVHDVTGSMGDAASTAGRSLLHGLGGMGIGGAAGGGLGALAGSAIANKMKMPTTSGKRISDGALKLMKVLGITGGVGGGLLGGELGQAHGAVSKAKEINSEHAGEAFALLKKYLTDKSRSPSLNEAMERGDIGDTLAQIQAQGSLRHQPMIAREAILRLSKSAAAMAESGGHFLQNLGRTGSIAKDMAAGMKFRGRLPGSAGDEAFNAAKARGFGGGESYEFLKDYLKGVSGPEASGLLGGFGGLIGAGGTAAADHLTPEAGIDWTDYLRNILGGATSMGALYPLGRAGGAAGLHGAESILKKLPNFTARNPATTNALRLAGAVGGGGAGMAGALGAGHTMMSTKGEDYLKAHPEVLERLAGKSAGVKSALDFENLGPELPRAARPIVPAASRALSTVSPVAHAAPSVIGRAGGAMSALGRFGGLRKMLPSLAMGLGGTALGSYFGNRSGQQKGFQSGFGQGLTTAQQAIKQQNGGGFGGFFSRLFRPTGGIDDLLKQLQGMRPQ